MSIATIHRLDRVLLPSAVAIDEISNARWSAGIQSLLERPAGHVHPMFRATQSQQPQLEFTTQQLSTLLGVVGIGGASLAATNSYFKLGSATGNVARATTSHQRITINSSVIYWTSIRLPHNGPGEANVIIACNFDGTNDPFVYTGSVALNGTPTSTEWFGAGPVAINGSSVPGVQEIVIDSGIQLIHEGGESEVWPTFVGIQQTEPSVTIRTRETINWSTIGLAGIALNGSSGLVFYARKFAANGARVANGTSQHIAFQGLLGSAIPIDTSGDGTSPLTDTLKCELVAGSDSVLPLLITTGSAIT